MKVYAICPKCHDKMTYRCGNVIVYFSDDEVGKKHEIETTHCDRCGINIGRFFLRVELENNNMQ